MVLLSKYLENVAVEVEDVPQLAKERLGLERQRPILDCLLLTIFDDGTLEKASCSNSKLSPWTGFLDVNLMFCSLLRLLAINMDPNESSVNIGRSSINERWLISASQFVSGIRPPSHIPTPGKLFEMSASATNARSMAMPPPVNNNNLKRKTLAERAGEPARPTPAPPSSRPVNPYVRATSIAGVPRENSFSSSVSSSRPSSSTSLRNVSNSSYSSSVGSANRPPSAQSHRSQSAMAHSRIQKPTSTYTRPTTSLEVYEEEPGAARKRKGMLPISLNPQDFPLSILAPKIRKRHDNRRDCTPRCGDRLYNAVSIREASLKREISLSNALDSLTLNSDIPHSLPLAVAEHPCPQSPTRPAPKADVEIPPTPSQIPKLAPRVALPTDVPSPSKSPQKTPKVLPKFLSKDSNIHIAWDTDSRLEEVENMCSQFKEKLDGATTESKSLKEMMGVYKIRSKLT